MNAANLPSVTLDIQENTIDITTIPVSGWIARYQLGYIEQQSGNRILRVGMLLEASRLPGDRLLGSGVYNITRVKIWFLHEFDDAGEEELMGIVRVAFGEVTDFEVCLDEFIEENLLRVVEFSVVECKTIIACTILPLLFRHGLGCAKIHPSRCGASLTHLGEGIAAVLAQQLGKEVGTIAPAEYHLDVVQDQLDPAQDKRFDVRVMFNGVPADTGPVDVNAFNGVLDAFDPSRDKEGANVCVFDGHTLRARVKNAFYALQIWM
jgi:hypothetical protein